MRLVLVNKPWPQNALEMKMFLAVLETPRWSPFWLVISLISQYLDGIHMVHFIGYFKLFHLDLTAEVLGILLVGSQVLLVEPTCPRCRHWHVGSMSVGSESDRNGLEIFPFITPVKNRGRHPPNFVNLRAEGLEANESEMQKHKDATYGFVWK